MLLYRKLSLIRKETEKTDNQVYIITYDPFDLRAFDEMFYLTKSDFNNFLKQYYVFNNEFKENEMVGLFNKMMSRAIEKRASDIHIEQHNEKKLARFRIDGAMYDQPCKIPKGLFIKI